MILPLEFLAEMKAYPVFIPVTIPLLLTVATDKSDEAQVTLPDKTELLLPTLYFKYFVPPTKQLSFNNESSTVTVKLAV